MKRQQGYGLVELLLLIILAGIVGVTGWYVWNNRNINTALNFTDVPQQITNFDECVAAGNPVMESFPEQCSANGQIFVNTAQEEQTPPLDGLIEFGGDIGIEIKQKSDVSKLEGASDDFKTYIASLVGEEPNVIDCSDLGYEEGVTEIIHVRNIYKNESASGGVINCSGAPFVWKNVDGVWQQVGQQGAKCSYWESQGIPKAVYSSCSED